MKRLRITQAARISLALLIPLPFLLFRYAWHTTNAFYHPDTYDASLFWLSSIPELGLAIGAASFVAFWRFRSPRVGGIMMCAGLAIFASLAALVWLAL